MYVLVLGVGSTQQVCAERTANKLSTAKKKGGGASSLSEEERDVIDLAKVESSMQAAITALKWEYSNTLVTRLTPGEALFQCGTCDLVLFQGPFTGRWTQLSLLCVVSEDVYHTFLTSSPSTTR